MKLIPISQNKFAKVDDDMYAFLMQWKWHFDGKYARRHTPKINGKQGNILMHKVVASFNWMVDHRDTDKLNNQKENLRPAIRGQNAANMRIHQGSRYKGVSKHEGYFRAQIWKDNERAYSALFPNERWAAMAYDLNAKMLFGEYAHLNFPEAISYVKE